MQIVFENTFGSGKVHLDVLKSICGDTHGKSMIDIGCYHAPTTPRLGFEKRIYIDIQERTLDFKEEQKYFIQCNALDFFANKGGHYDVAISVDMIEHLKKRDGKELLRLMQEYSDKQIIFTPLGEYALEETETRNPDSHRSGWLPQDFEGWATIVFPQYHQALNIGAFYAFRCNNTEQEFERISNQLKQRVWITTQ